MKTPRISANRGSDDAAVKKAIGGQPENDQDARDAGLTSASSDGRGDKSKPERASSLHLAGNRINEGRSTPPRSARERNAK